ncbi:GFA domain-containing protein [Mycena sanguinolenta]|uniref:GFA domain-containing protein n=1 Tax=Mycena sanguinolenta TaxID=230812 RepID=A0A8H6X6H3_9AGAR|nr:GFA domain-containing protein [Mycena sanguinolenta]
MSSNPQLVEYRGSCHCGAFKFKLKAPELKEALRCTCSICARNGYLWTYPWPSRENFTVVQGDVNTTLTSYLWGHKMMAHKFCPTCGTSVMEDKMPHSTVVGAPDFAINIRTLEDVDFDSLRVEIFDGATLLPGSPHPTVEPVKNADGTTLYTGNCHCGALEYTLLNPEKITNATLCNCSICWRDAALWVYPQTTAVTFKNPDAAVEYTFANKECHHGFVTGFGEDAV